MKEEEENEMLYKHRVKITYWELTHEVALVDKKDTAATGFR